MPLDSRHVGRHGCDFEDLCPKRLPPYAGAHRECNHCYASLSLLQPAHCGRSSPNRTYPSFPHTHKPRHCPACVGHCIPPSLPAFALGEFYDISSISSFCIQAAKFTTKEAKYQQVAMRNGLRPAETISIGFTSWLS